MTTAIVADGARAARAWTYPAGPPATAPGMNIQGMAAPDLAGTLAGAAIAGDDARIAAVIDAAIAGGLPLEAALVGPVAAAARRLGDLWVEDACDFVAVTMATWQLRRGVERVIDAHPAPAIWSGRRALFAAAPGDQHGFGPFLMSEVFARAGWLTAAAGDALADMLADEWIDLIGLTLSADRHRPGLAASIAALRRASRNPRLAIMVGGRAVADDPALVEAIGADGTAPDALAALALADRLVAPPGPPC